MMEYSSLETNKRVICTRVSNCKTQEELVSLLRDCVIVDSDVVIIAKTEYDNLIKNGELLQALIDAGVDNWEGYDVACSEFAEDEEEENIDIKLTDSDFSFGE